MPARLGEQTGVGDVSVGETDALVSDAIDMRCRNIFASVETDVRVALIISEYNDEVGSLRGVSGEGNESKRDRESGLVSWKHDYIQFSGGFRPRSNLIHRGVKPLPRFGFRRSRMPVLLYRWQQVNGIRIDIPLGGYWQGYRGRSALI